MKRLRHIRVLLAAVIALSTPAFAQQWPSKPVTLVTSAAPGGSSDIAARALAAGLKDRLGQAVNVDNRPGANSTIAANYAAKAQPDGYTLLFIGMGSSHPLFSRNNAMDVSKAMVPVSNAYRVPVLLYVRSSLPVASVPELLAYASANDAKVGVAATSTDLFLAALRHKLGAARPFPFRSIPYRSDVAVVTALVTGDIAFSSSAPAAYLAQVRSGSIRPIMVASPTRSALFPTVRTADEEGLAGLHVSHSIGVWAPAGTPPDVVRRLSAEIQEVARTREYAERLAGMGAEAAGSTPEQQLELFRQELLFWTDAARITGFQAQ